MTTAIEKLQRALPHILCGFKEASEQGKPAFAIAAHYPDGGGKLMLTIDEPEEFLRDICEIAGIPFEPTETQYNEYKVDQFLSKFGLRK